MKKFLMKRTSVAYLIHDQCGANHSLIPISYSDFLDVYFQVPRSLHFNSCWLWITFQCLLVMDYFLILLQKKEVSKRENDREALSTSSSVAASHSQAE